MRTRLTLCFAIAVVSVGAGCGGDEENSDQEAIAAVLAQLRDAQDIGDAETACADVYVIQEGQRRAGELAGLEGAEPVESEEAEAEEAAGESEEAAEAESEEGEEGESPGECEEAFEAAYERRLEEIKDLTTSVGAIEVDGDRATAIVHTELQRQDGSALSQDVPYDLVRTPDGWRVRIADEG